MTTLIPGQQLGPYQIIQQIGKGGMATVYKAYHAAMDRYVALKVVAIQLAEDPNFLQRFQQEARLIARLEHPHILPVHDFGEANGVPFMVMRFLEAGTLKERITTEPLTLAEVDRIFCQLADALQYSHDHGVIHRDIKPSNAMLDKRGDVFLTDFGVAKMVEGASQVTATGTITGTPAYMSPEQAQGKKIDHRSDIYSLGVVLYEMLTGRVPFEAETPMAVIFKHIQEPPSPLSLVRPDLPYTLEAVLLKALAKEPDDRYASMDAFREAWQTAMSEGEAIAKIAPLPGEAPPTLKSAPPLKKLPTTPLPDVTPPPYKTTPPQYQTTPPEYKTNPPVSSTGGKIAATVTPMLGGLILGVVLCIVCCVASFFILGAIGEQLPDNTPTPGAVVESTATPTGSEAEPTDDTIIVAAPPAGSGETRSWAGSNTYYTLAFDGDRLLGGGPGSLSVFNPDGSYQQLTSADTLPAAWILDFQVDAPGHIWVATIGGILEMNGEQRAYYTTENGLDSDYIRSIARVSEEEIWAGTQYSGVDGGGLLKLDGKTWKAVEGFPSSEDDSVPETVSNDINTISVNTAGVWVGTGRGLALYDTDQDWNVFTTEQGLPGDNITSVYQDEDGLVWVGTYEGALAIFDDANWSFKEFTNLSDKGVYSIREIAQDEDRNLWFAGGGIARYNPDDASWEYFNNSEGSLPVYNVISIAIAEDGSIYFGSEAEGLVHYQDEKFSVNYQKNLPRFGYYRKVIDNQKGNYYFVDLYDGGADIYTPESDLWGYLSNEFYIPMGFDANGAMWSGGYNGLWIYSDEKVTNVSTENSDLPSNYVSCVAFDQQGNAYLGTDAGVAVFNGKEIVETYTTENVKLGDNVIRGFFTASDDSLWVWGAFSFSHKKADGSWEHFNTGDLSKDYVSDINGIVEDAQGMVWVATNGQGLFRYDGKAWKNFKATDPGVGLPTDYLTSLEIAPDGSLWIGTFWQGVVRFDGTEWKVYNRENGLIHPTVYDIQFDENGGVWLATEGGITYLAP